MYPTREEVCSLAREELRRDVREDVGPNEDSGGRIAEYWSAINDPRSAQVGLGDSWCAAFVSWVFERAGAPLGEGYAYVPYLKAWLEGEGLWRGRDYEPSAGDIIIYSEGGVRPDHVGIVIYDGPMLQTVEGNLSNRLASRSMAPLDSRVLGYGAVLLE